MERSVLRLTPALIALAVGIRTIDTLNFAPNAMTNRITEYSVLLAMLPVVLGAVVLAGAGLKWALVACWPGPLRIVADTTTLTFQLGPLGTRRYATGQLIVRYPFEIPPDDLEAEAIYESLLDPDQQMATLLPRIECAGGSQRLDRRILDLTRLDEAQAARALRPFVQCARASCGLMDSNRAGYDDGAAAAPADLP